MSRSLRDDEDLNVSLEFVVAYLSNVVSIRVKDDLLKGVSPEVRQRQTFDGVKALFLGESERRPIVFILEDAHWIDEISERFFHHLGSSIAGKRIMILVLHRPEYNCPWSMSSSYLRIPVNPLSNSESDEMLENLLGVQDIPQDVKQLVQGKAEGNPFFVEELVMQLLEAGLICKNGGTCYLTTQGAKKTAVPATVQDVIMARIDRLEGSLKQILQLASVIGREFAFNVLEKIAQPDVTVNPALDALQRCDLIAEKNIYPELEYMFKHALTQNVTYNSLLHSRKKELHGRIAAAIEELKRNTLEEYFEVLAYHYKNGDRPEKAVEFLSRAGEKALELCSPDVARTYLSDALAVSTELPLSPTLQARQEELKVQLQRIGA